LWNGRARLHIMPRERSIDIDSAIDFKLVELLMREKRGG
jgi:CMP-N-acetylneuraminic acid synthetase